MKAIGLLRYLPIDDPESLIDCQIPTPDVHERDLLVRVEAISVNPVDTKVRAPKPKVESSPRILGWDAAGVVEKVGSAVSLFKPGDEVYYAGSITRPGTNSQFHLVDERIVGTKPATLSFAQAAALPLTTITAWEALFDRLRIDRNGGHAGCTLLIIGGAGGVGSIGIQLGKLAGLTVITTASRPESRKWSLSMGADHVVNHRQPLRDGLLELGLKEVDYITNFVNTDAYWAATADVIKPQGAICSIVENEKPLDLNLLKSKSVAFVWEFMFTRSMFETTDMQAQHQLLQETAALVDSGKLRTTVTETFSPINAENLRKVHGRLESGRTVGKLVLTKWQ
jgi:NADPH2:quinone reductase